MKLDPKVVADLAVPFWPKAYLRVMPKPHADTPLGMGFGQTRFAAPDNSFQLVYLARNLATGIAETVVRDRFEGKQQSRTDVTRILDGFEAVCRLLPTHIAEIEGHGPNGQYESRSGSTHAWAEVYLTGAGWIMFYSTNRSVGGFNQIPVAVARHIPKIMPVSGSFVGDIAAYEALDVRITVTPA